MAEAEELKDAKTRCDAALSVLLRYGATDGEITQEWEPAIEREKAYAPSIADYQGLAQAKDTEIQRANDLARGAINVASRANAAVAEKDAEIARLQAESGVKSDLIAAKAQRAEAAESELATIKARSCETCRFASGVRGDTQPFRFCRAQEDGGINMGVNYVPTKINGHPFGCSAWTPKEPK